MVTYTYSGNIYDSSAAGTTTFALTSSAGNSIGYLQKAHIHVYLSDDDGKTWSEKSRPAEWDFNAAGTSVVLSTGITAGQWARVLRITPFTNRFVDFADGSLLTADQLDQGEDFSRYVDQELFDQSENMDGHVPGPAVKKITGVVPIQVDSTSAQEPEISIDQIKATDDPNLLISDTDVMSAQAIDGAFAQLVGNGASYPPAGYTGKLGKLRVDNTGSQPDFFYWNGTSWVQIPTQGPKGDQGIQGIPGPPPGLQSPAADATNVPLKAGNVLGDATAAVTADGSGDLKFDFGIPVGEKGDKGDTSDPVVISQDTPPTFGDDVVWFNTVNAKAYFGYTDPDGDQYWVCISIPGPRGEKGDTGAGPPTTVADNAPESPGDGYVWHNSHNGRGYVYWSSQGVWVEM